MNNVLELLADDAEHYPAAKSINRVKGKAPSKTIAATELEQLACRIATARESLGRFYDAHWRDAGIKVPEPVKRP